MIPAAQQFSSYQKPFISGYPTTTAVIQSMIQLIRPREAVESPVGPLHWWELDLFVGGVGFLLLVFGGILLWRHWDANVEEKTSIRALVAPILILTIFAIGPIYWPLAQVPILGAERVSSRFIILPFLFFSFFTVTAFQHWFKQSKFEGCEILLFFVPLGLVGVDLFQHSRAWRILATSQAFQQKSVDLAIKITNHTDTPYLELLTATSIVSAVSFLLWITVSIFRRIHSPRVQRST